jgi:hypothetical protein
MSKLDAGPAETSMDQLEPKWDKARYTQPPLSRLPTNSRRYMVLIGAYTNLLCSTGQLLAFFLASVFCSPHILRPDKRQRLHRPKNSNKAGYTSAVMTN